MVRLVKPVRNYSLRRELLRLLLLVVPLALVTMLMAQLRDPETADRINRVFAPVEPKQPPATAAVDDRPRRQFAGISREMLASIEDNTYFRNAEKDAWFHFIGLLQRTSREQLASADSVEVDCVQLLDQPNFYRGKLVTVYGWLRQVTKQKPAANDLGLETYYRVVIQPTDGVTWPIFVYLLERPPGLPEGDDLTGNLKVTGLFFKNLSYRAQDGMGTAPVLLAKNVEYFGAAAGEPVDVTARPVAADKWASSVPGRTNEGRDTADRAHRAGTAFRDVLDLAGWDVERLAQFDDGQPLSDSQRAAVLPLLWRIRSFDAASLQNWVQTGLAPHDVLTNAEDYRGQLVRLTGRVTNVTEHALEAQDAERLEMPHYFECQLALDDAAGTASILTTRVPRAWLHMLEIDEPASAAALYVKRLSNGAPPRAVWLAKEVAWHPAGASEPFVSFGMMQLGKLGMDVGLLEQIEVRGQIRSQEREAFYQMLDAAGRVGTQELAHLAQGNLPAVRQTWQIEFATADDQARRNLAREVVARAADGRYSVAPLFNDPEAQIGQLVVVDGVARRAVRVDVGGQADGDGPSDVVRRFGFDHYYEMEVFTDDSQNYPLVFCIRELPAGFPTGGSIHVPVRMAGFFFKDWLYRTRRPDTTDNGAGAQYAPLLVGRGPLILAVGQRSRAVHFVLGGLFVAAVAGIWAVAAWHARGDRRFRAQTPAAGFSLPPGQSLNELNLPVADVPMKDSGHVDARTRD